jgi:hypothetical protein
MKTNSLVEREVRFAFRMVLQSILIYACKIYACMVIVGYGVGIDVSWRLLLWFWITDTLRRFMGFELAYRRKS